MEHFGNKLRKVISDKMVTHKYMADRLGVKPQRFYQITKMADVKLKTAIAILDIVDMSVQEFLDYGKEPEHETWQSVLARSDDNDSGIGSL